MSTAVIHRTMFLAELLVKELGMRGQVYPMAPGAVPCGAQFHKVIVLYDSSDPRYRQWFDECVRCRLVPDGRIVMCSV